MHVNIQKRKENTHIKTFSSSEYQSLLLAPLDLILSFADWTPLLISSTLKIGHHFLTLAVNKTYK